MSLFTCDEQIGADATGLLMAPVSPRQGIESLIQRENRFLEHARIFYFRNSGREEVYLGSADLMPRNLNRRVEVVFPPSALHERASGQSSVQ